MIKNIKEIILIISIAVAIAVSAGLYQFKETEEAHRVGTEERLAKEKVLKKKSDKQLSFAEEARDNLQKNLGQRKQEAESLEAELIRYRREVDSTRRRITELDTIAPHTEKRLKEITSNIEELKKDIAGTVKETLVLEKDLGLLQKTTEALKRRLSDYIKDKGNMDTIAVSDSHSASPLKEILEEAVPEALGPRLVGEVLTVNREFDFVVISLGRGDGIEEGMVVDISRDNKVLGQAEVETVRENISAAALVNREAIAQMRAGDKVLLY